MLGVGVWRVDRAESTHHTSRKGVTQEQGYSPTLPVNSISPEDRVAGKVMTDVHNFFEAKLLRIAKNPLKQPRPRDIL